MSSLSEETDFDLFVGVDEKDLAGADFTAEVIGELRRAFSDMHDATGLTQKAVADRLGASKSAVHRWLYGDGNMTVRKLGELMWAMRCRPSFQIAPELTADQSTCEEVPAVGLGAPVAQTPAVSNATETDSAHGWYHITPMTLEDVKKTQVFGAPVNLAGYCDDALIHGRIMSAGQNNAIARFHGMRICSAPLGSLHQPQRASMNIDHVQAPLGLRAKARPEGIRLFSKGEYSSVEELA